MKKIINLLIILCCAFGLAGCANNSTIKESRTIILEVDTEVVPTFASNFGTGSYDSSTKKYTHTIDYIKDLYISLSYDNLKSVTVYIPTKDMQENIITRQVKFGDVLDVEVEITVEGVKTLEGLEIDNTLQYTNLNIGKKNTFKFTLPSREQDYEINFTLPNYRAFSIDLSSDELVSGSAEVNTVAITEDQVYIGFKGYEYSYQIYSFTTNKLLSSGYYYSNEDKTQYILLDNNDSYYVYTSGNSDTNLYKVQQGQDKIIEVKSQRYDNYSYIRFYKNNQEWYGTYYIYEKNNKILRNSSGFYGGIENAGLLLTNEEGDYLYLDDLASKVTPAEGSSYEYIYNINEDDFTPVTIDVTRIHKYTGEVISRDDTYYGYMTPANFNDNVFEITVHEIKSGYLSVTLKDKEGKQIGEKDNINISSDFGGIVYSDTLRTNDGKLVPYLFPIFYENMTLDSCDEYDCYYTYPDQIIDTSVTYTMIKLVEASGNVIDVRPSSGTYVMDEDLELIMGTDINDTLYFELVAGKVYTLHYGEKTYEFTVTENDIKSGNIIIYDSGLSFVNVKIADDITLSYNDLTFVPNSEGIVNIPVENNRDHIQVYLSNSYVNELYVNINIDGSDMYEVRLYALNGGDLYGDYGTEWGSNGLKYVATVNDDASSTLGTNLYQGSGWNRVEHTIEESKFVYSEEYQAYYYDLEAEYDHVVTVPEAWIGSINFDSYVMDWETYKYYVSDDAQIEFGNETITLTDYAEYKYLEITILDNGLGIELVITPKTN